MAIYIPYFYIIQDTRNNVYYAGAKWGKDANPETFMVDGGYTTSSKIINEIIDSVGVDTFVIRKMKIFNDGKDAIHYETRFLQKIDAKNNPAFYNQHNNDHLFSYGDERYKQAMLDKYGVSHPKYSEEIRQRVNNTVREKYGVDHFSQTSLYREKFVDTSNQRYGTSHPMQNNAVRNIQHASMLENHGVKHPMQSEEIRSKYTDTCIKRYGHSNPMKDAAVQKRQRDSMYREYGVAHAMQSDEVKQKCKDSWFKKYGVDNPSKSENVRLKISQKSKEKTTRSNVAYLRELTKKYKITLGRNWSRRDDAYIYDMISQIETLYS